MTKKIFEKLGTPLLLLFISWITLSSFAPALPGTISGFFKAQYWQRIAHGKSALHCNGYDRMTIRGQYAAVQASDLTEPFNHELLTATDHCKLELIDCELSAPDLLMVRDSAYVLIQGGQLTADKAISANDSAIVEVRGAEITGSISRSRSAQIIHGE